MERVNLGLRAPLRCRAWAGLLLLALSACLSAPEEARTTWYPVGTYDTAARWDDPSPAGTGTAPFEGSLGPPVRQVDPNLVAPATTTREGSAGPPIRNRR